MEKRRIYLDNQATTPVDPRVLEAMLPYFGEQFGNAASRTHSFGWEAEAAVEDARGKIAGAIGASGREIVFTSGATEADNLAIKGVTGFYRDKGNHIVTVATEHRAVLDACQALERNGQARLTVLEPDPLGLVSADQVTDAIGRDTVLVSVMHANNEIGVIHPLEEIAAVCREAGVLFHSDAAQSFGKLPLDVSSTAVDLVSISAHKIYGPKGIGALYLRGRDPRVRLEQQIHGGGHERGMRSGTLNVPAIVGMGRAAEIAVDEMASEGERIGRLRSRLLTRLGSELDLIRVNGDLEKRLPGNLNVSFAHVEGESLLMALKDVALSSGSACTSASLEPSYVLGAIGVDREMAHSSLRFGIGRFNGAEDIDYVAGRVIAEVRRLRRLSPLYERASLAAQGKAEGRDDAMRRSEGGPPLDVPKGIN